jgi:hypothetical protein
MLLISAGVLAFILGLALLVPTDLRWRWDAVLGWAFLGSGLAFLAVAVLVRASLPSFSTFVTSPGLGGSTTALAAIAALVGVFVTVRSQRGTARAGEILTLQARHEDAQDAWLGRFLAALDRLDASATAEELSMAIALLTHLRANSTDEGSRRLVDHALSRADQQLQPGADAQG